MFFVYGPPTFVAGAIVAYLLISWAFGGKRAVRRQMRAQAKREQWAKEIAEEQHREQEHRAAVAVAHQDGSIGLGGYMLGGLLLSFVLTVISGLAYVVSVAH